MGFSRGIELTISTALRDVHRMSLSAFTSTEVANLLRRTAIHQAASGFAVRNHHDALRVQDLGRLRHEPDAAERQDVALELLRLPRELQAVPHRVGNLLDFRFLVMMRQDHCLAVLFEVQDLFRDGLRG